MQRCLIAAPLTNMNEKPVLCTDACSDVRWKKHDLLFAVANKSQSVWKIIGFTTAFLRNGPQNAIAIRKFRSCENVA
jgi:hypothetical protein